MKTISITACCLLAAVLVAGCAAPGPAAPSLDQQARSVIQASFRDQGIAKVDRLQQDLGQSACSDDKAPPDEVAERVQAEALASVKWPTGGQSLGHWVEGCPLYTSAPSDQTTD